MNDAEIAFNLFYILLMFGLIYPPQEFCSAGNERLKFQGFSLTCFDLFRAYDRKFIL